MGFKKVFLITLIVAFCISALIGIIVFIFGQFNDFTGRILLTTLVVGVFSLFGLSDSALYETDRSNIVALIGLVISVITFVFALYLIWVQKSFSNQIYKSFFTLLVLSVSFAHICLMLLIKSEKSSVNISLSLTIVFIITVAIMIIILIFTELRQNIQLWYRLIGIFAILDVLGTICTPILRRVTRIS